MGSETYVEERLTFKGHESCGAKARHQGRAKATQLITKSQAPSVWDCVVRQNAGAFGIMPRSCRTQGSTLKFVKVLQDLGWLAVCSEKCRGAAPPWTYLRKPMVLIPKTIEYKEYVHNVLYLHSVIYILYCGCQIKRI